VREEDNRTEERPTPSAASILYGSIVYWGTIVASVLATVGMVFSFVTAQDYMPPSYVLSSVWGGRDVGKIWEGSVGSTPDGHWYLGVLDTGSGLTMAAIALGVFIIIPAMAASALALLRDRQFLFALFAGLAVLITLFAIIS
jgi:hypothetical protein